VAVRSALTGMEADVHTAPSYTCLGCSDTTSSLVEWQQCCGCSWASAVAKVAVDPPTNVGPLCLTCSNTHEEQQCGTLKPALDKPICDRRACGKGAQVYCDGCKRALCQQCLVTMHRMAGLADHSTWQLPSVDAGEAAIQG
jgi:hypothetical protein